jgi:hypothetical protein
MQVGRRGTRAAALVGVASLSLLVSACGGSDSAAPPTARGKPTTTTSAPATTTTNSTATAVPRAYRAGSAAFEHASADGDPEDPELTATMVAPRLTGVRANLVADQQQGMVGRGTFTLHPKIMAISATTATVVDCAYSTSVLVYAKTGKPVPPIAPPENDGVQSELVLTGGCGRSTSRR